MMNYEDAHKACQNMERMGGGFESKLAKLFYHADGTNSRRLIEAFPEIFEKNLRFWLEDNGSKSAYDVWLDDTVEKAMKS
jgi:hypothetical protein